MSQAILDKMGLLNSSTSYSDLITKNPNLIQVSFCFSFSCAGTNDGGKMVPQTSSGFCRFCRSILVNKTMSRNRISELRKREKYNNEAKSLESMAIDQLKKIKRHINLCKKYGYKNKLPPLYEQLVELTRKENAVETSKEERQQVATIRDRKE